MDEELTTEASSLNKQEVICQILEGKSSFVTMKETHCSLDSPFSTAGVDFIRLHTYENLPGPKHVRLLKTHYIETTDSLSFEFITTPLVDVHNQFVAISYCWGLAKPDRYLHLCDQSVIAVSANVEALLTQIFSRHDGELIWLDAVCINQSDLAERSAQVQIMKDIYEAARRVSVWLGAPEGDEFEAAKTLLLWQNGWNRFSGQNESEEEGSDLQSFVNTSLLFRDLLSMPWFTRVWVIQEVCFGRMVWLHYGRFMITMQYLQRILEIIRLIHPLAVYAGGSLQRSGAATLDKLKKLQQEVREMNEGTSYGFTIESLYSMLQGRLATDPRDQIFALLSLADPRSHGSCIIPDYNSSTWDVYVHAAGKMLKFSKNYNLLSEAGIASRRSQYDGKELPSWVPDFGALPTYTTLDCSIYAAASSLSNDNSGYVTYCERWGAFVVPGHEVVHGVPCPARQRTPLCPSTHLELLSVVGGKVDTIVGCISIAESGNVIQKDGDFEIKFLTFGGLLDLLEQTLRICEDLSPYPTGESPKEVCARTLITNRIRTSQSQTWEGMEGKVDDLVEGGEAKTSLAESNDLSPLDEILEYVRESPSDESIGLNLGLYEEDLKRLERRNTVPFWSMFQNTRVGTDRQIFWTEGGYIGMGLSGIKPGDEIWLANGARVPFVARFSRDFDGLKLAKRPLMKLVCEAYVHGIMTGEALRFKDIDTDTLLLLE